MQDPALIDSNLAALAISESFDPIFGPPQPRAARAANLVIDVADVSRPPFLQRFHRSLHNSPTSLTLCDAACSSGSTCCESSPKLHKGLCSFYCSDSCDLNGRVFHKRCYFSDAFRPPSADEFDRVSDERDESVFRGLVCLRCKRAIHCLPVPTLSPPVGSPVESPLATQQMFAASPIEQRRRAASVASPLAPVTTPPFSISPPTASPQPLATPSLPRTRRWSVSDYIFRRNPNRVHPIVALREGSAAEEATAQRSVEGTAQRTRGRRRSSIEAALDALKEKLWRRSGTQSF
jgi:hypothetical protein